MNETPSGVQESLVTAITMVVFGLASFPMVPGAFEPVALICGA